MKEKNRVKRIFGWVLTILGGFFCFVDVMCIPVPFTADDMSIAERIFMLIVFLGLCSHEWYALR